jgi:hypothetical protein
MPIHRPSSAAQPPSAVQKRLPLALRQHVCAVVDQALLASRKDAMSQPSALEQTDDATRRNQGYRSGLDECRRQLKKVGHLENLPSAASLSVGAAAGWLDGVQQAFGEAHALYASELRIVQAARVDPATLP